MNGIQTARWITGQTQGNTHERGKTAATMRTRKPAQHHADKHTKRFEWRWHRWHDGKRANYILGPDAADIEDATGV